MSLSVTAARVALICLGLLILLALVIMAAACVGQVTISPIRFIEALVGLARLDPGLAAVVFDVRLPRVLLAALAGMGLSMGGVVFQAILRNPLADPYILGVSSGAGAGAVLVLSLGVTGGMIVSVASFSGALLSLVLVLAVAAGRRRSGTRTIILAGVIVGALFSAMIMLMISLSPTNRLHNIMFWLFGDLSTVGYERVVWVAPIVVAGCAALYTFASDLNLLSMGDRSAAHMGVSVERVKLVLLTAVTLLVGVIVSVSGIIGFVGLVVPHLARLALGPDHRLLMPAAVLFGGTFLVAADTLARVVIAPAELPVGVIMAFVGAPFFLLLLMTRRT